MTGMLIGFGFGLMGIAGGYVVTRASARLTDRRERLTGPEAN